MGVVGHAELKFSLNDASAIVNAIVSTDLRDDVLVSWHDLIRLRLLPPNFPCQGPARARVVSSNRDMLKDILLAKFPVVLSDELSHVPMSADKPMHVYLKTENIKPVRVSAPRKVPIRYQAEAEKTIKDLTNRGVIVAVTEPSQWCSPAFFVPKADGTRVRLVTDYTALNKYVKRPTHPFPSSRDIIQAIPADARVFAKFDAVHGYFQLGLDDASSKLTTFLLPMGRFRYLRAPMGLSASSDEWCRRSDVILDGLPWARKIVDDTLIWAPDWSELQRRCCLFLDNCRAAGVTISKKKFECGERISFAGYDVSSNGIRPDPKLTRAISDFPSPKNIHDVRSLLGLANQLGSFLPDLAQITVKIRELLKKSVSWIWLEEHEEELNKLKAVLTSPLLVKPFDPDLPVELLTDAARLHGLGYALLQREHSGRPRLIMCGSCSLTDTQKRYATIELECLAIQWAIRKCDYYLRGLPQFRVITDHRPLVGIFAKALPDIDNPRLMRMREKLTIYSFQVDWVQGKTHLIADALSRSPVFKPDEDSSFEQDSPAFCFSVEAEEDPALQLLVDAVDDDYRLIVSAVTSRECPKGLPRTHPAREFLKVWDRLSILPVLEDSLVALDGARIVVPPSARPAVLRELHKAHCGYTKTRKLASQLYYWPGMSNDVSQVVDSCRACQQLLPSLPNLPPVVTVPPVTASPMTDVAADLFDLSGRSWLLLVDRASGFPWAAKLSRTDTASVTSLLERWFNDFGWPLRIRTDGGPQFRGPFKQFCSQNGIVHELSSPYHPESNGLAEQAVKTVKHLLIKCAQSDESFDAALYAWRTTPRADGFSPYQVLFGRSGRRAGLPSVPAPPFDRQACADVREQSAVDNAAREAEHSRPARQLNVNEIVFFQHPRTGRWTEQAKIISRLSATTYCLSAGGANFIRNRRFLRPRVAVSHFAPEPKTDICDELQVSPRRSARLAARARRIIHHPPSLAPPSPSSLKQRQQTFYDDGRGTLLPRRLCGGGLPGDRGPAGQDGRGGPVDARDVDGLPSVRVAPEWCHGSTGHVPLLHWMRPHRGHGPRCVEAAHTQQAVPRGPQGPLHGGAHRGYPASPAHPGAREPGAGRRGPGQPAGHHGSDVLRQPAPPGGVVAAASPGPGPAPGVRAPRDAGTLVGSGGPPPDAAGPHAGHAAGQGPGPRRRHPGPHGGRSGAVVRPGTHPKGFFSARAPSLSVPFAKTSSASSASNTFSSVCTSSDFPPLF